jgi:hypothetical protein
MLVIDKRDEVIYRSCERMLRRELALSSTLHRRPWSGSSSEEEPERVG